MSDVAKDRLLAVGARFASFEHANATTKNAFGDINKLNVGLNETRNHPENQSHGKMSFWKKNSGKVPGRPVYGAQHPPLHAADAHLATYIKGSKNSKLKTGSSFQDFEGSTLDAWDEDDCDLLKVGSNIATEQIDNTTTGSAVRDQIGKDMPQSTPKLERLSSSEESNRQPQADNGRQSKASNIKNIVVSKISEKLGKTKGSKNTSPVSTMEDVDFPQENYLAPPQPPSPIRQINLDLQDQESTRLEKFGKLLAGPTTDLEQLKKLSWNGIPSALRGTTWRLLSGYLPPSIDRRQTTLERKQTEYHNFVAQYYPTRHDPLHQETYRQIHIDIPRTNPLIPIFQQEIVQEIFERILFIWAIRHPASGYVQGINDLVVPFFVVFLSEHIDKDVQTYNINNVSKEVLQMVEADSFWCMSKLLDGIQDNYTFAQPGIQMKVNALKNLVNRIDSRLNDHIFDYGIDYLQFTFRWMNNLLMRELPLIASIRLWDTYWAETDGFAMFHLYVCAALLTHFSKEILNQKDFQGLMMFLQNLPLKDWGDDEVSCILAEAYRLKYMFADAPKHIGKK